jgi:hypothetical protein
MSEQNQTSPFQENLALGEEEDKKLQEPSQEPPRGGGDERKVATLPPSAQKTSIARNGSIWKAYIANYAMIADPWNQFTRTVDDIEESNSRWVSKLKAKSLQASKNFDFPRLPFGTPTKRPFENSAKDGISQGKEKKIKD